MPGLGALSAWFEELLEPHRTEIELRGLVFKLEVEPEFLVLREASLGEAIRELLRLILATVPDGCEVYIGGARSMAPVSRIGAGRWITRWQVTGERTAHDSRGALAPLHPRPGDAQRHVESSLGERVTARFAETDWEFSLEAIEAGGELVARATRT